MVTDGKKKERAGKLKGWGLQGVKRRDRWVKTESVGSRVGKKKGEVGKNRRGGVPSG